MPKYVDAEKLIKRLKEIYDVLVDAYDYWDAYTMGFCEALETVEDMSNETTTDVQDVKHGKWIKCSDEELRGSWLCGVRCSICGKPAPTVYGNYCSICGAKMDGGEKTDED